MNRKLRASAIAALTLACHQAAHGVTYDARYSAFTLQIPGPGTGANNDARSGEAEIGVLGTGDAAYLQCIDNNLRESGSTETGYRENIQFYSTRKIEINENWWFESNIHVLSTAPKLDTDPDAFSLGADVIDQGAGNHGFEQLWYHTGADRVAGGTGANQDQIVVTTLDDPSPTTASQNLITYNIDFSVFHRIALQRDVAAAQLQLFVDGKNVGSRALADFSNYPPPAYNDGGNYEDLPGTGVNSRASWELREHEISLGEGVRRAWNATGDGSWSTPGNWFAAVPDGVNTIADFGRAITGAASINLDSARTLATVAFDSPFGYTIGGTGTLTLDGTTLAAPRSRIDNYSGHNFINTPVSYNSTIAISVIGGSTLTINGQMTDTTNVATYRVTKFGDGQLELKNVRAHEIEVNSGTVKILPDGTVNGASYVNSIGLGGVNDGWTGNLDVTNNSVLVDYTAGASPLATIANQIKNGYANGAWTGNGVLSSSAAATAGGPHPTAIGYAESTAINLTDYFGQPIVDADSILVKYTLSGDSNLDGLVNALDFNAVAANYGSGTTWVNGDFNYDGMVDSGDFGSISMNFNATLLPGATLGALVPEPGCLSILLGIGLVSSRRRRCR